MKSRKYDSAAYVNPDRPAVKVINIEDLISERIRDNNAFVLKYSQNLFCPECVGPQLSLCRTQNGFHLRGFKNQEHKDDCGLGLDDVPELILINEFKRSSNPKAIQLRLKQAIDSLLKKTKTHYHPFAVSIGCNRINLNPISREKVSRNSKQFRIPAKSLTAPFGEDDYNRCMVFYGRVKIRWEIKNHSNDPNKPYAKLIVYKTGAKNPFCSGTCSEPIYKHIKNNVDCDNVLIAMFTCMTKNKTYSNFKITHSSMIVIEKE